MADKVNAAHFDSMVKYIFYPIDLNHTLVWFCVRVATLETKIPA